MSEPNIPALRTWAAEVSGYKPAEPPFLPTDKLWVRKPHESLSQLWQPDQNIAQAFETLDAVGQLLMVAEPVENFRWWKWAMERHTNTTNGKPLYTCKVETGRWYEHDTTWHESREMAILLACHAAWRSAR